MPPFFRVVLVEVLAVRFKAHKKIVMDFSKRWRVGVRLVVRHGDLLFCIEVQMRCEKDSETARTSP